MKMGRTHPTLAFSSPYGLPPDGWQAHSSQFPCGLPQMAGKPIPLSLAWLVVSLSCVETILRELNVLNYPDILSTVPGFLLRLLCLPLGERELG